MALIRPINPTAGGRLVKIGSHTVTSDQTYTKTFDISSVLANYQSLSASDFLVVTRQINGGNGGSPGTNMSGMQNIPSLSYNASTGVVNVTAGFAVNVSGTYPKAWCSVDVYYLDNVTVES